MNNKLQQQSELVTFLIYRFVKISLTKQWVHSIAHLRPQSCNRGIWPEHATGSLCLRFWSVEIKALECRGTGAHVFSYVEFRDSWLKHQLRCSLWV